MSGLSNEDVKDIALSLIGRCDDTGISFDDLGAGISEAVIAIKERAVNAALTEAADAIEARADDFRAAADQAATREARKRHRLRASGIRMGARIVRTRTTA